MSLRLVVRRRRFLEEVAMLPGLLEGAMKSARDLSRRRRLGVLAEQSRELWRNCLDHYEEFGRDQAIPVSSPRDREDAFLARALGIARSLESASTDGFAIPQRLRQGLASLGDDILRFIHELRRDP